MLAARHVSQPNNFIDPEEQRQRAQAEAANTLALVRTAAANDSDEDVLVTRTKRWRVLGALRMALALSLIVLSLWSLLLPVSLPISSNAAVTARVTLVTSPMRGEVRALGADVGDRVRAGLPIADIGRSDAFEDDVNTLRAERARIDAQRAAVEKELKRSADVRARYDARQREFTSRIVKDAERLAQESELALSALSAKRELELAAQKGPKGEARVSSLEALDKDIALERHRLLRQRAQIDDAKAGFVLTLGYEPPGMSALPGELEMRVVRLEAEQARLLGVGASIDAQIIEAEKQRRSAASKQIESPVNGLVWARPVHVGQFVAPGSALFRIADQRTLHVQAHFHRRYLDGMAIGHKASLYLVAARQVVKGTVKSIQALDTGGGRDEFALDLPAPDEEHFKVLIELDEQGRKVAEIGGVAKVAVVGSVESRLQRALLWLYMRFES